MRNAKRQLRAEIRRRLAALTPDDRRAKGDTIARRLIELPDFRAARTVMLYAGMPDEIDTAPIAAEALRTGKRLGYPRCIPETRELEVVDVTDPERDLVVGFYGLREPVGSVLIAPGELDLVLVPGLAFDRAGNRLGRGAGYYDRFLSGPAERAFRLAAAFDRQVVPAVPHDLNDLPVHAIVTERAVIRVSSPLTP